MGQTKKKILPRNKDDRTTANEMAKHYVKKIEKIRNELHLGKKEDWKIYVNSNNSSPNNVLTEFSLVDNLYLGKVIASMKNKTCNLDPLPTDIVKKLMCHLLPAICRLVNSCILESKFPDDLKTALVTPVIKDKLKDSEDFKNYRAITNLPFLSKILEQVLYLQLNNHIESNGMHCNFQSAYRKDHSCETSMIRMTGDIQTMIHKGKVVAVVLLDNSAAFDTVDHQVLLDRLEHDYCVKGAALNLIRSYLDGRKFSVMINEEIGDSNDLCMECLKGVFSVLCSIFFMLNQ